MSGDENVTVEEEVVDIFEKRGKDEPDPLVDPATLAATDEQSPAEPEQGSTDPEPQVPDKFKGKTLNDVIEMYGNLESAFGRRNNEIGELRKLTDEILQKTVAPNKDTTDTPEIDKDAFFDDPAKVIHEAIAQHPVLKQLSEQVVRTEIATNKREFEAKHGIRAEEAVNIPGLSDWIMKNPERVRRWNEADATGNFSVADDLITTFREVEAARKGTGNSLPSAGETRAALDTPQAGSAGSAGNPTGKAQKKRIFKRAQLMRLRIEDPERYAAMNAEIQQAYAEGRVK